MCYICELWLSISGIVVAGGVAAGGGEQFSGSQPQRFSSLLHCTVGKHADYLLVMTVNLLGL